MSYASYGSLPWTEVDSSNLRRIAFLPGSEAGPEEGELLGVLYVEFHGGLRAYAYTGVPSGLHEELLGADSVGSLFNREVKGTFEADRIELV
jgi:KTSC domain